MGRRLACSYFNLASMHQIRDSTGEKERAIEEATRSMCSFRICSFGYWAFSMPSLSGTLKVVVMLLKDPVLAYSLSLLVSNE